MISNAFAAASGLVKFVVGGAVRLTAPLTIPTVEAIKRLTGCKTHHVEDGFVLTVLVTVMVATGWSTDLWTWVETLAVWNSFRHACIAQRMEEQQAQQLKKHGVASVGCYHLLEVIFIQKEALWMARYINKGMWGALAGVLVFLAFYPWREVWREHHPLAD